MLWCNSTEPWAAAGNDLERSSLKCSGSFWPFEDAAELGGSSDDSKRRPASFQGGPIERRKNPGSDLPVGLDCIDRDRRCRSSRRPSPCSWFTRRRWSRWTTLFTISTGRRWCFSTPFFVWCKDLPRPVCCRRAAHDLGLIRPGPAIRNSRLVGME